MKKGLVISILSIVILISIITLVSATEAEPSDILAQKLADFEDKEEIVELRSENRRTFKNGDGKLVTFLSTNPLNYLGEDERFYPIDTNIVNSTNSSPIKVKSDMRALSTVEKPKYPYVSLYNTIKSRFSDVSNGGVVFESQNNQRIEFILEHKNQRPAIVNKNKIRYEKIFDNCDLEYTVLPGKVKDELIFYSAPKIPIISYKVNMFNLKPKTGRNGGIDLVNNMGEPIFSLLPSVIFEKGNEDGLKNIETKFHWERDQLYCDLILDMGWLKDKKRKYPIIIDPQVVPFTSYGLKEVRFLLHAPESYSEISCEAEIDGPEHHGNGTKRINALFHFKDLTAGITFDSYNGLNHHYYNSIDQGVIPLTANHDYEVYVRGGKSKNLAGKSYYGKAWVVIKYGDDNLRLFGSVPERKFTTIVDDYIIQKHVEITKPQTITYKFIPEFENESPEPITVMPNFEIYQTGSETPVYNFQPGQGKAELEPGTYIFKITPKSRGQNWYHFRTEISLPFLTASYESHITMRTGPGVIDSTFMLPRSGDVKLQYQTKCNGQSNSESYPNIKIMDGVKTLFDRTFDLGYYNSIDGGDKVYLEKEKEFHLIVSRGIRGDIGWGFINVDLYHEQNKQCTIDNLRLSNPTGQPAVSEYGGNQYHLCFDYNDPDNNSLKIYKLTLNQIKPEMQKELLITDVNIANGQVIIPYTIKELGLTDGSTVICRVDVSDGFDTIQMLNGFEFTVDNSSPVITAFSGIVNSENDNSIVINNSMDDQFSGINKRELFWKINGQDGGNLELSATDSTVTIPNLPYNARIEVFLRVTDNVGNLAEKNLVIYTYPEKANLIAPRLAVANTPSQLKISKADTSYIRIERYRGQVSETTKDYDTGYLDPSNLGLGSIGNPKITITGPANGTVYSQPAIVYLASDAMDVDGKIVKVQFYSGANLIGEAIRSPYNFTWRNAPVGTHQVTAKAIDNDGLETVSNPISITVKNNPAEVMITSPIEGDEFNVPAEINIDANAFDSDGHVVKVEFYANDLLIGTDSQSPYSIQWSQIPMGLYTLVAKAVDNNGDVSSSNPITVKVSPPPIGSYEFNFNCQQENAGVHNRFSLYIPANNPVSGYHSYTSIGEWNVFSINNSNDLKLLPYNIRVKYTVAFGDPWDENKELPYFKVILSNGQQLIYESFINATRSRSFIIPANQYVIIDWESGRRQNNHTIHSDDNYGYNGWYRLEFEYVYNDFSIQNSVYGLRTMKTVDFLTTDYQEQFYCLLEPKPAQSHETYIYKIYTKNGDKEVSTVSDNVPVMNSLPEIRTISPEPGITAYSNGTFKLEMPVTYDEDGDNLKFFYSLSGLAGSGETTARQYEWRNLTDGEYSWQVTVKDNYGGETTVGGRVVVDKAIPIASFKINNQQQFTNNPNVTLSIFDFSENVVKVQVSNDKVSWTDINYNAPVSWNLPDRDGSHTVYLRAQNAAGVVGPVMERSIMLDRIGPNLTGCSIQSQGGNNEVSFRWSGAIDQLSGISGYNVELWNNSSWQVLKTNSISDYLSVNQTGYNVPVKIRIQAVDFAGISSDWMEALGYTKAAAGTIDLAKSLSGYTKEDGYFIQLQLNPAEGAVKYKIICTEDSGGGDTDVLDASSLVYQDTGLVKHGVYKYKVYTFNSQDEITENITEFEITVANNPPQKPEVLSPVGFINKTDNVQLAFDRPMDSLDVEQDELDIQYLLSQDGINFTLIESSLLNNLVDGKTYWWKAHLDDGFGGVVETDVKSFTVDITPPELVIDNYEIVYAAVHKIHPLINEIGSGLSYIKINGSEVNDIPQEVILNQQGVNPLLIEVSDKAGNVIVFQHTYYVDLTPPTLDNLSFSLPQNNGKYLSNGNVIPTEWHSVDPETGIMRFNYTWSMSNAGFDPNSIQSISLLGGLNNYSGNLNGRFEDGETYYLHIQPENFLGQKGVFAHSPPLLFDHTAPELKVNTLNGGRLFNGFTYYNNINDLELIYEANDPHTGITKVQMALVENKNQNPEEIRWFDSLAELKSNTQLVSSKVYYVAVRAFNGTLLSTTVFSNPLVFDNSAPVINISVQPEQKDNQLYTAVVNIKDEDTGVIWLEYAIGSTPGASDLSSGLPGAKANGWFAIQNPGERIELSHLSQISVGTVYYFTVKAENIAGLSQTVTSSGTKVIEGNAPVVRDDGRFSSGISKLHFEWFFANLGNPVVSYRYRIRCEEQVIKDWTAANTTSINIELALVDKKNYFCDVQAIYNTGSYSEIGTSDGILIDTSAPVITSFTTLPFSNGNSIEVNWAASDPESGIKAYLGIGEQPNQTGVSKGWIAVGNMQKIDLSQDLSGAPLQLADGKFYYVTLMVENGAGAYIQQLSPAIQIDKTPPAAPWVIDEGNYTNRSDLLRFSWKWPIGDPESGIREYWYALTTQRIISGSEEWYCSLTEKEITIDDLELIQGETYYLVVKAINNAGLEQIGYSDGILIDTTAPGLPQVIDYGDYSSSNNSLQVSVIASDAESGISRYELSLGTATQPDIIFKNRVVLTNNGMEIIDLQGIPLQEGEVYYFTVKAINQAGLDSMVSMSDGIMVDSKQPEVETVTLESQYLTDPTQVRFAWKAKEGPSGIGEVQYAISADPNGAGLNWKLATPFRYQAITGLDLKEGTNYYVFIRVQSRAAGENTPEIWSTPGRSPVFAVDLTPPEVRIIMPTNGLIGQNFPLHWETIEPVSGVVEYRYSIGTYRGGTDITGGWVTMITDQKSINMIRSDLKLENNQLYYLSVLARNGAGLWSPVTRSEALKSELTPPQVTKLEFPDSYLRSTAKISGINWAGTDSETGITAYRIKLVQTKDATSLDSAIVPVSQGSGVINLDGLSLKDGQSYYIALQVQNGVGTWSDIVYSQAIMVDVTKPVIQIMNQLPEMVTNSGEFNLAWKSSEAGKLKIELTHPNGAINSTESAMAIENIYRFMHTAEGRYNLKLTPYDMAGNEGDSVFQVIRLNSKPVANAGPDITVAKGTVINFIPEASDSDGTVIEYVWDFGNGKISFEEKPSYSYTELSIDEGYTVTLKVKDNDGKWSEPVTKKVKVTNTSSGEMKSDEEWDGEVLLVGDVLVPKGTTLKIKPGCHINFSGNYSIKVYGKVLINGTSDNPVVIGGQSSWNGIRLENCETGSVIHYAQITNATVGIVIAQSDADLFGNIFRKNRIGIHVIAAAPTITQCTMEEHELYGIKEDAGANPTVIGCIFIRNGANYYEDLKAIISLELLNQLGSNRENR